MTGWVERDTASLAYQAAAALELGAGRCPDCGGPVTSVPWPAAGDDSGTPAKLPVHECAVCSSQWWPRATIDPAYTATYAGYARQPTAAAAVGVAHVSVSQRTAEDLVAAMLPYACSGIAYPPLTSDEQPPAEPPGAGLPPYGAVMAGFRQQVVNGMSEAEAVQTLMVLGRRSARWLAAAVLGPCDHVDPVSLQRWLVGQSAGMATPTADGGGHGAEAHQALVVVSACVNEFYPGAPQPDALVTALALRGDLWRLVYCTAGFGARMLACRAGNDPKVAADVLNGAVQ